MALSVPQRLRSSPVYGRWGCKGFISGSSGSSGLSSSSGLSGSSSLSGSSGSSGPSGLSGLSVLNLMWGVHVTVYTPHKVLFYPLVSYIPFDVFRALRLLAALAAFSAAFCAFSAALRCAFSVFIALSITFFSL